MLSAVFASIYHCFSFGQGSSYTGIYTASLPIVWNGQSNKMINNLAIANSTGHCISLINCSNITIQNCKLGPALKNGVYLYNCTNIKITNCTIDSVSTGVSANLSTAIKVTYNDIKNVIGPYPQGQMTQFNEISGGDNSISYNVAENVTGQSNPEDVINLYKSNGIAGNPIQVVGNWIRGRGTSSSGGGINAGDNGGSYMLIKDNILVNPGSYGITITSGTNITISNNKIFAAKHSYNYFGLMIRNQYSTTCSSNTVMNNEINYMNATGQLRNMYDEGTCGGVVGWNTNVYNANLSALILPTKIIGRAKGTISDINTISLSDNFRIYPNPAMGGVLVVEASSFEDNNIASIYDLKGKKLIEKTINSRVTEIDTSNLIAGVYILRLSGDNKSTEVKKIILGK